MAKQKAVVVEDDANIAELIVYNLSENGYEVLVAEDGVKGLAVIQKTLPHVVILDLMLPEMDGIEVCKALKSNPQTEEIPIIMLTAKSTETDKVLGLELGADDYMTKPFSIRELLARIKVVIRRAKKRDLPDQKAPSFLRIDDLIVDIQKHEVSRDGQVFQLTFKEFELLRILLENKGTVMTRDQLLDEVWGYDYYGETRTVDVHIRHVRKKIETQKHKYIETIRGVGYKIK